MQINATKNKREKKPKQLVMFPPQSSYKTFFVYTIM